MKLGYMTLWASEAIEHANELDFAYLELVSLPAPYGCDMVNDLDSPGKIEDLRAKAKDLGIEVSSINTMLNPMSSDASVAQSDAAYLRKLIILAGQLGVPYVSSSSGQNTAISLDENYRLFGGVYRELVAVAEANNVKIVFENCLHGFPSGVNIAVNPETWEALFNEVDSPSLGLEFDPSHLIYQFIDPVSAARKFASRIMLVHGKDTEILKDKLAHGGIHSPSGFWRFALPGYGDVDWAGVFRVLRETGFDGHVLIENEDSCFENDRFDEGLLIARQFLKQFVW